MGDVGSRRHVVIVPTRGDDVDRLRLVLEALGRQSHRPDEILVVGPQDLDVGAGARLLPVARLGSAHQRNVGLRCARAEYGADVIHLVDDDVELDTRYVEVVDAAFDAASVVGVTGQLIHLERQQVAPHWARRVVHRRVRSGAVSPGGRHQPIGTDAHDHDVGWLPGGLLSFRARCPVEFDEVLESGPTGPYALHEDLDFSLRLAAHGRLAFVSAASAVHVGPTLWRLGDPDYWEMRARVRRYLARKPGVPVSPAAARRELATDLGTVMALAVTRRATWSCVRAFVRGSIDSAALPAARGRS